MSMLLKKIESLEKTSKDLVEKWDLLMAENDQLKSQNDRLRHELSDMKDKLELEKGKTGELEKDAVPRVDYSKELTEFRKEVERNLALLRKYRNGI